MIRTEKLNSIERALVAAATMSAPDARNVLRFICEAGMTTVDKVEQTPGQVHYAKREKFINRMQSAQDRILNYAKHETLRKVEKHFRLNPPVKGGEDPVDPSGSLATRLTFDRPTFTDELLAALRDESAVALGTAGQQLYDEIGKDDPFKIPDKQAVKFLDTRANLLAGASDDLHKEVMRTIQDGLENGETRGQLMTRIGRAFDEIKKSRAETIANTETAAAFNFAREKAMRNAGVTHKKWLHSMSPLIKEPRPTHLEADGQVQPIDEPFDIGGVPMQRPGDESAGPEEVINCHCVAIPVEAPIHSGDKPGHEFHGNQYTKELSRITYEGIGGKETLGEWLQRHEIPVNKDGTVTLYHATPKKGGSTDILRKGSLFETDPKAAQFFAQRDRGLKPNQIIVHQVRVPLDALETGHWPSINRDIPLP